MKPRKLRLVTATGLVAAATAVAIIAVTLSRGRAQTRSTGVSVNVSVPAEIPAQITDAQAQYAPSGALQGITYKLVNRGAEPLTGAQITWSLKFAGGGATHAVQYKDYWAAQNGPLPVGSSDGGELGAATSHKPGGAVEPLESATGTVAYVEFEDGSKFGPNLKAASSWFAAEREARLAAYRELLQTYRAGGEDGLVKALQTYTPAQTGADRGAHRVLYGLYRSKGVSAVIAELTRVSTQQLPAP
jgi:hypothetical protein